MSGAADHAGAHDSLREEVVTEERRDKQVLPEKALEELLREHVPRNRVRNGRKDPVQLTLRDKRNKRNKEAKGGSRTERRATVDVATRDLLNELRRNARHDRLPGKPAIIIIITHDDKTRENQN